MHSSTQLQAAEIHTQKCLQRSITAMKGRKRRKKAHILCTLRLLCLWLIFSCFGIVWIAVDAVYLPLYIAKDLRPTAFLYLVYLALALRGLVEWRRSMSRGARDSQALLSGAEPRAAGAKRRASGTETSGSDAETLA